MERRLSSSRSFRGRFWAYNKVFSQDVKPYLDLGIPAFLATVFAAREIPVQSSKDFLRPKLKDLLPDPFSFKDMDKACFRFFEAIKNNEKIAIWGDYDCDGATSSAIVLRFLKMLNTDGVLYIPDRLTEGYGPNAKGLLSLKNQGISVVVVVDSGTVAFESLKAAKDSGLDVIVVDHHAAEHVLPEAVAVVNPNRLDETGDYGYICAAGMAFLFVVGVNSLLRDNGFYKESSFSEPDLMSLLDIVALGTICDVVPLVGVNRAFVKKGLEYLSLRKNLGISTLCSISNLKEEISSYACGFVLGPRINAGGRVGRSETGALLLSSDDPVECDTLARSLDAWNKERQLLEKSCVDQAKMKIISENQDGFLIVAEEGWHEGVVGIVASRVKDAFDKPCFVLSIHGDIAKGSGRGVSGFDLGRAVLEAQKAGLVLKGGGHAMAAGVTLKKENIPAFKAFMTERLEQSDFSKIGIVTEIDMILPLPKVTVPFIESLMTMAPFGMGNPQPRFMIPSVSVRYVSELASVHLKLGLEKDGVLCEALLFSAKGTDLGEALYYSEGQNIDIVGTLSINTFNGIQKPQIFIEDARFPISS